MFTFIAIYAVKQIKKHNLIDEPYYSPTPYIYFCTGIDIMLFIIYMISKIGV